MEFPRSQRLPHVPYTPSASEMVTEIFAESARQKLKHTDLGTRSGMSVQKIQRIKAGTTIPKINEFTALCDAVGKTWREIEDAAAFHNTHE